MSRFFMECAVLGLCCIEVAGWKPPTRIDRALATIGRIFVGTALITELVLDVWSWF